MKSYSEAEPYRVTILEKGAKLTKKDRDVSYGSPVENMANFADLIEGYLRSRGLVTAEKAGVITSEDAAHIMVLAKMARCVRPELAHHEDNYVDGAAYMAIAGECSREERE